MVTTHHQTFSWHVIYYTEFDHTNLLWSYWKTIIVTGSEKPNLVKYFIFREIPLLSIQATLAR